MGNNKKTYLIIGIFAIIFTFFGGSLAYWQWETANEQRTAVNFEITEQFSCSVDGGGNVSSTDKMLAPASCTNEKYAIQRTITATADVKDENATVSMDLWLDINSIDTELSQSANFKYALTTNPNSCTEGVIESGSFTGKSANSTAAILNDKIYTATGTDTYYLYIWLDAEETNQNTMDKNFSLSLNGSCETIDYVVPPNEPVLDDGMIPITLSETGVATVANTSSEWYNYEEKEWANAVLVKKDATADVEGSRSREYYLNNPGATVLESDILAYYVWIPRYKYRIQDNLQCSILENPSTESNSECYSYILSDSDKELFIEFWYNYESGYLQEELGLTYTMEEVIEDVETMLSTGSVYMEQEDYSYSFTEILSIYNYANNPDITYTATFNGNDTITGPRPIDIIFESADASVSTGDAINTYYTHPSFIWDGETIPGLWVGKFETSGTASAPTIKPNVSSLRSRNVSTQFTTSLVFAGGTLTDGAVSFAGNDTYGLTTKSDSHMMKNSEWGAVAYLSHSSYGINSEIYINNSSGYYTGRSGGNVGGSVNTLATQFPDSQTSTSQYNSYGYYTWTGQAIGTDGTIGEINDSTLGTKASTTGNITGVYDMSGGAWENVMGNYAQTADYSGFSTFPENKYYDLYSSEIFTGSNSTNMGLCTLDSCGGDALFETANWYSDYAYFASSDSPWFKRGGSCDSGAGAGAFGSYNVSGGGHSDYSWRSSLLVAN